MASYHHALSEEMGRHSRRFMTCMPGSTSKSRPTSGTAPATMPGVFGRDDLSDPHSRLGALSRPAGSAKHVREDLGFIPSLPTG